MNCGKKHNPGPRRNGRAYFSDAPVEMSEIVDLPVCCPTLSLVPDWSDVGDVLRGTTKSDNGEGKCGVEVLGCWEW